MKRRRRFAVLLAPGAAQKVVSPVMTEPLFKLSRVSGAPVSDAELIADLQRVAQLLNSNTVPQKKYGEVGAYDYSTVIRRFALKSGSCLVFCLFVIL